jgi:hypothetical protein
MSTPEGQILASIMEYLAVRKVLHFRMNTGAVKTENRFFRFGTPGMSDIIAFRRINARGLKDFGEVLHLSKVLFLECKTPKGKQSEAQKAFQALVESHGHIYAVVRSIEDVESLL